MTREILQSLGGLGFFLLGLVVMTDSLRRLAGDVLRRTLGRFTRSPSTGALTGALTTALIQSSSATTVAAVGFVGAGLLTFPQALGIVFGANVGTTVTGWLVALLGFKLEIGTAVLPLVLLGVLLRLFRRGRVAAAGTAVAGFGLIFVGIEMLQTGLGGLQGVVTPASFPPDTWSGRALLVAIGVAITLVTQSSSAGVATALAGVNAGALALPQACAMVIGMDIGTTVTAVMATVGASTPARRTGWAHVIFNLITGLGAYLLLPLYVGALARWAPDFLAEEPEISLVGFHSLFATLGALGMLPFAPQFARLVERLVPDRVSPFARRLDRSLLREPASAIDVVSATLFDLADKAFAELAHALAPSSRASPERLDLLQLALSDTRHYVARVRAEPEQDATHARQVSALHAVDHLGRLVDRCLDTRGSPSMRDETRLAETAARLGPILEEGRGWLRGLASTSPEASFRELWQELEDGKRDFREHVLRLAAQRSFPSVEALERLDAMRWLRRETYHAWRILHHLRRVRGEDPALLEDVAPHVEPELED